MLRWTSITISQAKSATPRPMPGSAGFHKQFPDFDYTWINYRTMFEMLQAAINKAGVTDPMKIALALEGMEVTDAVGQKNTMRREDHQLIDQFYAAVFTSGVKYRFRRHWVRLEDGADHPGITTRPTHNMQDETTRRSIKFPVFCHRSTAWIAPDRSIFYATPRLAVLNGQTTCPAAVASSRGGTAYGLGRVVATHSRRCPDMIRMRQCRSRISPHRHE